MATKKAKTKKAIQDAHRESIENLDMPVIPPELLRCVPPGWKLRPIQARALLQAYNAFKLPNIDYVILEAPPGVGKSLLAVTLARYFRTAALCTLTVQLQEQYKKDFEKLGLRVLKGRRNFRCAAEGDTCEVGVKIHQCGERCPYTQAKNAALAAPLLAANYHSFWFHMPVMVEDIESEYDIDITQDDAWNVAGGARQLVIFDECHGLEGVVMDQASVNIRIGDLPIPLPDLPKDPKDPKPYVAWLKEVLPELSKLQREYAQMGRHDDDQKVSRIIVKVAGLLRSIEKRDDDPEDWQPTEYIVGRGDLGPDKKGELDATWFELKPLHVRHLASRYWKGFPKALFMSATILSAEEFVKALGLPGERCEFVQIGESFPPENRPILAGNLPMNYDARDESWPAMVKIIENLLSHHSTEKGLILASSGEMVKYIMSKSSQRVRERLIPAFGSDRLEKYNEHFRRKDPTVLLAPGYWEGADLKEDASRFQILPACPRPQWQGQIAARAKLEPKWYRWLTYTKLIQGLGRSIRSETDTACTYILDRDFTIEMNKMNSMIPPWVKAAVKVIGQGEG